LQSNPSTSKLKASSSFLSGSLKRLRSHSYHSLPQTPPPHQHHPLDLPFHYLHGKIEEKWVAKKKKPEEESG